MPDNRQMPQGEDLPDWLRGHIHPYPGEEPAPSESPAEPAGSPLSWAEEPEGDSEALWFADAGSQRPPPDEIADMGGEAMEPSWLFDDLDEEAAGAADAGTGPAEPEAVPPSPAEALPDWLEIADSLGEEPAPAAAIPDWLAAAGAIEADEGFVEDEPAADEEGFPSPDAAAVPDWLAAADELTLDDEEEAVPEEEAAEAATPEWVLVDTGQLSPEHLPPEAAAEEDLTYEEWQEIQAEAEREPSAEEMLAEEVPDWFEEIGAEEASEVPSEPVGKTGPEFVPDWYLGLEEQGEAAQPEWFDNLDFSVEALAAAPILPEEPPEPEPPAVEAAAAASLDELPDWFADMPDQAAPPDAGQPPDVGQLPGAELPDWFADIGAPPAAEAPAPPAPDAAPAAAVAEQPDWFAEFEEAVQSPAAPVTPAAAPVVGAEGGLAPGEAPDWLAGLSPEVPAEALSSDAIYAGGDDFMKIIDEELGGEIDPLAALGLSAGGAADAALLSEKDATFDLDALLAESGLPPIVEERAEDEDEIVPGLEGAEMPDWLADAQTGEPGTPGYSAVGAVLRRSETPEEELSERLRLLRKRTGEAAAVAIPAAAPSDALAGVTDGLSPTTVFSSVAVGRQVQAGVTLDKTQEARVATLSALLGLEALAEPELDEEGRPLPVDKAAEAARIKEAARRARARSRRKPLRLVITVALVVAVILPFFADFSSLISLPVAAFDPARNGEMDAAIQALRSGDRVLIGFEYGPTSAGEMDALAVPLLMHILLRGAQPVIVSTNPAGILHARDVLSRLAHDEFLLAQLGRPIDRPLTTPDDYVILPYLPGGVVGLRALTATSTDVSAVDRGVFAVDLEGNPTGLNVRFLQTTFKLVLTLAERGEDLRQWVEQVGVPVRLPLAAAVSVAAEPVALPYLHSGQLVGLLSGYRDAYVYNAILMAALPPVVRLPLAGPTSRAAAAAIAGPTRTPVGEPADIAEGPSATPSPTAPVSGLPDTVRLITYTPFPSATPTATFTPSITPSPTQVPTEAPTLTEDELTAAAEASPTPPPTATERIFVTATPQEAGPEASPTAARTVLLPPDQTYRDTRWYSLTLGTLAAAVLIGVGALFNLARFRSSRRRRDK